MREMTLGQIAYEAYMGKWGDNFEILTPKQQERWQRSAEAVLAAAREREAALVAQVERLQSVVDGYDGVQNPVALEALRRRERSIGAEEELRRLAANTPVVNAERLWTSDQLLERADAIAAERDHLPGVGKKVEGEGE